MRSLYLSLLHLPAILAAPLESRRDYELFSSHPVPREWQEVGKPDSNHIVSLRIGLKQASFDELERNLYEVSDPDHARYGDHLSVEEISALVAPSEHSHNAVHDWLAGHSISKDEIEYSPARDWLILALPLWKVESLLDTKYSRHASTKGKEVVRTPRYSLPKSLHEHIDVIQPTNYFGNWKLFSEDYKLVSDLVPVNEAAAEGGAGAQGGPGVPASCATYSQLSSLQCYREFYRTTGYIPQVPEKNYVGTTNYLGEVPSKADFAKFMATNRRGSNPRYTFTTQIIANASNDQTKPGAEADLDVELVGGFAYPTRFTTYSTGGSPPFTPDKTSPTNTNEPYLTWLDYVLQQKDLPTVITTSYGDDEQTVPKDYATRVCAELAQLGTRGVTLLFSSGDSGVGTTGECVSNDGKNTPKFLPAFPAACPYITAVGGTRDYSPEQVAFDLINGYVSGSGFSEYFKRPSYQDNAVTAYLKSIGTLNSGLYNPNGRAYPDIAAQSFRFTATWLGREANVDGTSVASPLTAGILTLVNDALLARGKKPLGFLNPLLYASNGKGFNDIVKGSSTGCNTTGFPAKAGWDVASGFGTPDFPSIRAALGV